MLRSGRFDTTFQVLRPAPLAEVKGRDIVVDEPAEFEACGNILPAGPKERQKLPEGKRSSAAIMILTQEILRIDDVTAGTRSDTVIPQGNVYKGVEFEIQAVTEWPSYRAYLATKKRQ